MWRCAEVGAPETMGVLNFLSAEVGAPKLWVSLIFMRGAVAARGLLSGAAIRLSKYYQLTGA